MVKRRSIAQQKPKMNLATAKPVTIEQVHALAAEPEQPLLAEILGEIFLALAAQTNPEDVLDEILRQVRRVVTHCATNIMLLEDDNRLRTVRSQGYKPFGSEKWLTNLKQQVADFPLDARIIKSRQPLVIADTHQNPEWVVMPETAWIRSSVSVPICVPDRVLGLLRLDSDTPGAFSAQDVQYLQHLANAAAIVLTNARLYDQAQRELAERIKTEKELRYVAAKNQAILDAIPDAMFYLSRTGDLLDYKISSYNELLEIPTEVINGSHLSTLLPPNLVDLTLQYIAQTLDTGKIQLFEYELGEHHFEVRLVKSGPNEVLAIVRNITHRKQTEAELQEAKEAAEAANRAKSTFLANMGHELHTPLHHIIGYSEMLQEEAFDLRQESFLPDLRKIEAAGKHLLTLVDSILDLAKIEAGKMELQLETFRVPALIDEVVTAVGPLLEENGNILEVYCPDNLGAMWSDRAKVRQVLLNLLSNAAKFTEQGMITLTIGRLKAESEKMKQVKKEFHPSSLSPLRDPSQEWLIFSVADTGMGIAPEQQPHLFRAFTQVDPSTTRRHGGSGLGLVISQRFCQMMGGNITVESELGRGSTFTVYLPVEI